MIAGYQHSCASRTRIQWDDEAHRPERRRRRLADVADARHQGARRRLHASARRASPSTCTRSSTVPPPRASTAQRARRGAPRALLRPLRGGRRARRPARARLAPSSLELFEGGCRRPPRAPGRGGRALPHGPGGRGLHRRPARAAGDPRRAAARACAGHGARAARRAVARRVRRRAACSTRSSRDAEATRSSTRASAPRRCGRPSQAERVMRDAAPAGMAAVAVNLETHGDRRRRARAGLPARRARLGRAVAGLPGAARRRDRPAGASSTRARATGCRTSPTSTARRASCTTRRSRSCRSCCAEHGIERPVLVGHSDGGSIALIHACAAPRRRLVLLAPHVFVEDISVASIAEARDDVRDHGPARAHGPLPPRRRGAPSGSGTTSGSRPSSATGTSRTCCRA